MAKTKSNPEMENGVERKVDFNLKKEDLMLLILEGRKENMEEEIAKIQQVSSTLHKQMDDAQKELEKKVRTLCMATINADAKKLAKAFSGSVMDEESGFDEETDFVKGPFRLRLNDWQEGHNYTKYESRPIGDGKGSTFIKQNRETSTSISLYRGMTLFFTLSLHGKTFLDKSELFQHDTPSPCREYSKEYTIADQHLDVEKQRKLPEYIKLKKIVEDYNKNESLLSDILAEYDLFNRNQPRAKAKMIKEVLGRDEQGQALLDNIITAAKGQKLLA